MGQGSSSQRPPQGNLNNESREQIRNDQNGSTPTLRSSISQQMRDTSPNSLRAYTSALSSETLSDGDATRNTLSWPESGDLNNIEDRSRTRTRGSVSSAVSGQSRMSRLGTRILPNAVLRNLLNSGEETPAEGRAHRNGLRSRTPPLPESQQRGQRFTSIRNFGTRGITRRRSNRGPYTLPSRAESVLVPDYSSTPAFLDDSSTARNIEPSRISRRYRSQFSHVRHSLSSPISLMFGQNSSSSSTQNQTASTPTRPRSARARLFETPDHLDMQMGVDESNDSAAIGDSSSSATTSLAPHSLFPQYPTPNNSRQAPAARESLARPPRREEQSPLFRVLQLAATAIAAQLSGSTSPTMPNIQSVGTDSFDGPPIESLMNGLQQASNPEIDDNNDPSRDPTAPHVNFLRVFRFINHDGPSSTEASVGGSESNGDRMDIDSQDSTGDHQEQRLLTLVVVGVRAIPNITQDADNSGSNNRLNVESLLRLPFLAPGNFLRNDRSSNNALRRADGRSRVPSARSAGGSIGSSARNRRSHPSSRRESVEGASLLSGSLPTTLSDSPQGPNAPPSTPAEPGLSRVSSAVNTPSRRPSFTSSVLPQVEEDSTEDRGDVRDMLSGHPTGFDASRQRRRSDSEAARHRGLGSGAARRNGVVEPDDASTSRRSWLIYVVGTNLAENHPAFAAPSLFTDNPTYEDMMLLSSLLGPAKPPIATQDEVSSAGGLFRLVEYSGSLVAESSEESNQETVPIIAENERCLVCLSDYEAGDEVRLLNKCKHIFHRECIDEWLTTGRNSCPLCRGEGVSHTSTPTGNSTGGGGETVEA